MGFRNRCSNRLDDSIHSGNSIFFVKLCPDVERELSSVQEVI